MSKVSDRLWIGSCQDATSRAFLEKEGITHVLNCTHNVKISSEQLGIKILTPLANKKNDGAETLVGNINKEGQAAFNPPCYPANCILLYNFPISNICNAPIKYYFRSVHDIIRSALETSNSSNVLIFSHSGRSRASTFLLAHQLLSDARSSSSSSSCSRTTHDSECTAQPIHDAVNLPVAFKNLRKIHKLQSNAVSPNLGFWKQLLDLEAELRQKSVRLPTTWPLKYRMLESKYQNQLNSIQSSSCIQWATITEKQEIDVVKNTDIKKSQQQNSAAKKHLGMLTFPQPQLLYVILYQTLNDEKKKNCKVNVVNNFHQHIRKEHY